MHGGAALDEQILQASGPPGIACESSSRRADTALHTGSARVQELRQRNGGNRLRGETSQLEVEPARSFVLITKREKRACRSCEELGVVSAPLPPRIIEKCSASDRIVIATVVGKYCNHTPCIGRA